MNTNRLTIDEYNKIKYLTYLEYCDYLQKKYGIGKSDCMTANYNKKNQVSRTNEGLIAHHKYQVIMLSTKEIAMMFPIEFQKKSRKYSLL